MTSVSDESGVPASDAATIVGFVSHAGDTGRTSAAANVAWILASAGHRVLVLDRSTETPGVDDFLLPFLVDTVPVREVLGQGPVRALFAGEVVRRYRLPATTDHIDVLGSTNVAVRSRMEWSESDGSGAAATMREALRLAGYGIVLVDSTVDSSDFSTTGAALLYDAVVVCFLPRRRAVERAAALAGRIRDRAPVRMRVVAVATNVDDRDELRAQQARSLIAEIFGEFLAGSTQPHDRDLTGELIEIPRHPYDAYDEVLAVLMEELGQASTLLAGYERLASSVTGEAVELKPLPPEVRERYRRGLGIGHDDAEPETIHLLYAPRDRPWADWITGLLEAAGVRMRELPGAGALRDVSRPMRVMVVTSPNLAASSRLHDFIDFRTELGPGHDDEVAVVLVNVEDPDAGESLISSMTVDITRCSEEDARTELLSHLGMITHAVGEQPSVRNFPRSSRRRQGMGSLPPRNSAFVGRDSELNAMRDYFLIGGGVRQWMLIGAAGIGKSEIAQEYAHRFGFDYDIVWWVSARNRQSVRAGMARLAAELKVGMAGDAAAAALAALSHRPRSAHWLLVYDNADEPGVLEDLVPESGFGDVIVTARSEAVWRAGSGAQIAALEPVAGVELLRSTVSGLTTDDAAQLAHVVEHVPLALRLVSAWLRGAVDRLRPQGYTATESASWAAAEFQDRFGQVRGDLMDELAGGSVPPSVSRVLTVVIETLEQDGLGRLALRLAELCAFLSPDGVALRLLRSAPMRAKLVAAGGTDAAGLAQDAFEFDPLLTLAARSGLCDVAWGSRATLRMHSVMQLLLRELMDPDSRRERQRQVLRGLAAVAPADSEGEDATRLLEFVELQRHLVPSGALDSADRAVRRWLVDQVWWLYMERDAGAWQSAVDLAEKALERWLAVGGDPDLRKRLMFNLANLHRGLGRYDKALELDEVVLTEQRRDLGLTHLRTLRTARGKGGDLRALGRFDEALAEDQATWQGFREILGEDHPETLSATNNLALSSFLTGDVRTALVLEQGIRKRRLLLFGPEHPLVFWSACNIATNLRELGDLDQAASILQDALIRVREVVPPNHPDELRVRRSLAVTLRRQGRAASAKERDGATLQAYRELFSGEHPAARACALSLAADYHAIGDAKTAAKLATDCFEGYLAGLGTDHPFTNVCRVNLGLFLHTARRLEEADQIGSLAVAKLRTQLGETHPWTLAAAINHALTRIDRGDARAADSLLVTYDTCCEFLGSDHPYARATARTLKILQRIPEFGVRDDDTVRLGGLEIDVMRY